MMHKKTMMHTIIADETKDNLHLKIGLYYTLVTT